jgi:hypothetical protein
LRRNPCPSIRLQTSIVLRDRILHSELPRRRNRWPVLFGHCEWQLRPIEDRAHSLQFVVNPVCLPSIILSTGNLIVGHHSESMLGRTTTASRSIRPCAINSEDRNIKQAAIARHRLMPPMQSSLLVVLLIIRFAVKLAFASRCERHGIASIP